MAVSPNTHIMLLESAASEAQIIKEILTKTGFKRIESFSRPSDALEYFSNQLVQGDPVQLVLCAGELLEMSGVDFFLSMKEADITPPVKFLLLTGNSEQSFILKAVKAGVRNILLRPFSRQSLIAELAKLLG